MPRRRRQTKSAQVAPTRGRVIALFGPPKSGVSTLLRVLQECAQTPIAVLRPGMDGFADEVRQAAQSVEAVFLDGFPFIADGAAETAQWLYDERLIFPGSGALVRVAVEPNALTQERKASADGVRGWFRHLDAFERHARVLQLPYFTIHNESGEDGLAQAVSDLARRARVTR